MEKSKLFSKKKNIFKYCGKLFKLIFRRKPNLLNAPGAHIITGYPGAGKTLLMSDIINKVDSTKYYFLSNLSEFNGYDNVYTFDISAMFGNCTQLMRFPLIDCKGRHLYGVIFDEINLNFNRRLNRKSTYNDLFIGLIEFLVTHRHQGVPRVYFIGQKLELQDTQLQSLFKYRHDIIRAYKRPCYWYYYNTNTVAFIPRKFSIVHWQKDINDIFAPFKKVKYKLARDSIFKYDTHALRFNYSELPVWRLKKIN